MRLAAVYPACVDASRAEPDMVDADAPFRLPKWSAGVVIETRGNGGWFRPKG